MNRKQKLVESAIRKIIVKVVRENRKSARKRLREEVDLSSPEVTNKIKKAARAFDNELKRTTEPILLVDDNRGIHSYEVFADRYVGIALNSDDEGYADDYQEIVEMINDNMRNGYIYEDSGIWLYPNDYESEDDY